MVRFIDRYIERELDRAEADGCGPYSPWVVLLELLAVACWSAVALDILIGAVL